MTGTTLPAALVEIREEFTALEVRDRLQLLLEFSNELPDLPARFADHPDLLERVVECQSPVYLFVEVVDGRVHLHATAPREAPTTRGFASILAQGLDGLTVDAGDWWFNLRSSNTEPLLRLNLEAPDAASCAARVAEVQALIAD